MNIKKLLASVIVIVFAVLSLSACGTGVSEARADFEDMMDAFKTCDRAQIDKYYNFDELVSYLDETQGELLNEAVLSTLSKMDYKIISSDKLGNNAVNFKVEITTIDFSSVVNDFIERVILLTESSEYKNNLRKLDENNYEALITEKMIQAITEFDGKNTTKTVEITMVRDGGNIGEWIPAGTSDEFLGHLFENLSNAVKALV